MAKRLVNTDAAKKTGAIIEALIDRAGVKSIRKFARERCPSVPHRVLYRIINGEQEATASQLRDIAAALGVDASVLLGDTHAPIVDEQAAPPEPSLEIDRSESQLPEEPA